MSVSVSLVIPSVDRPAVLSRALAAATQEGAGSLDIVVVARDTDFATHSAAEESGVRVVKVSRPGLSHAMRQGALSSSSEVVAFSDDDAELMPGWLERLQLHYSNPEVVAVGGRDVQIDEPADVDVSYRVGTISWFGAVRGGHHTAIGPVRDVAHLKGVNCSFRRSLFLEFDASAFICGTGAQARNELMACLAISRGRGRILFDPNMQVLHTPAARADGDSRGPTLSKVYEAVFNETLAFHLASHPLRWVNSFMLCVIGYGYAPGILRSRARRSSLTRVHTTLRATWDAIYRAKSRGPELD